MNCIILNHLECYEIKIAGVSATVHAGEYVEMYCVRVTVRVVI